MQPLLKWAGSKRQLVPQLLARAPWSFETYHEPFFGAGALFFALASESKRRFKKARIADTNPDLIALYLAVRDEPVEVVKMLASLARDHERDGPATYASVRSMSPEKLSNAERGARLYYLNKTCFNGLWRVNKAGKFNVPIGKFASPPKICDSEKILAASLALVGVDIEEADFRVSMSAVRTNDFCYVDPPYLALSKTSDFSAFAKDGFNVGDHETLADASRSAVDAACGVIASNADVPLARELYLTRGFEVVGVEVRRSIAASEGARMKVGEILAMGRPG